jgi:glycosyltransferase involved in cell wall biosynthesis
MAADVTVVLPTLNRGPALRENLPTMLALERVSEIIVVDGGSTDDTVAVAEAANDPRLRVVHQAADRPGLSAAKNIGAEEATKDWIVIGEDDCWFPSDYAAVLREEADRHRADLVGAPWLHIGPAPVEGALEKARLDAVEFVGIDSHSTVPREPLVTPFIPAPCLIRRAVFERVRFDEGYLGNSYRQETAFCVEALRTGFTCVLTPETALYQRDHWEGGARAHGTLDALRYENSILRNNWRFLRKHGAWLHENGYMRRTPSREQLALLEERLRYRVGGTLAARLGR